MAPKGAGAKGKGKGKAKDTSDAGDGKDDNKKGGKGLKPATSINVRHILVCPFSAFDFLRLDMFYLYLVPRSLCLFCLGGIYIHFSFLFLASMLFEYVPLGFGLCSHQMSPFSP
jgi:hypothetical protein